MTHPCNFEGTSLHHCCFVSSKYTRSKERILTTSLYCLLSFYMSNIDLLLFPLISLFLSQPHLQLLFSLPLSLSLSLSVLFILLFSEHHLLAYSSFACPPCASSTALWQIWDATKITTPSDWFSVYWMRMIRSRHSPSSSSSSPSLQNLFVKVEFGNGGCKNNRKLWLVSWYHVIPSLTLRHL